MTEISIYHSEQGKRQILNFYENVLKDWCRPSEQYCIDTRFGKTFVIESGNHSAPEIVLLHGTGSNSAMWIADAMELSKDYHVFAIDILGECGKSSENRPCFKGDNYSDWVGEILENLRINKPSIIACSLGAWIALDFSIKHPQKVNKLVLLAPGGITQVKASTIVWIIITSFLGKWGFSKLNKMVYGNLEIDNQVMEFASLVKKHFKPRAEILPLFTDEQLKENKASTLFIGGDKDCFYDSQKSAERLSENLAHFKYFVLKNTGHVLVNQTLKIRKFLKG